MSHRSLYPLAQLRSVLPHCRSHDNSACSKGLLSCMQKALTTLVA